MAPRQAASTAWIGWAALRSAPNVRHTRGWTASSCPRSIARYHVRMEMPAFPAARRVNEPVMGAGD